jgi:DNA-binding NarL/FixJ family response regulator
MDLGLPGKDGYALAKELRDRFPKMRVIALSGYGMLDDIHRSIQAGFDEHLVKPAEPDELNGAVHKACEARHHGNCE